MAKRLVSRVTTFCPNAYCAVISAEDASNPGRVSVLQKLILDLAVPHTKVLDHFIDLYRDYPGRFYDADAGFIDSCSGSFVEVFLDIEPLLEAPDDWWKENFGPASVSRPVKRLKQVARPRWQALGSIYFAWHPWHRVVWSSEQANDNRRPVGG